MHVGIITHHSSKADGGTPRKVRGNAKLPTRIALPDDEDCKAARVGPWETFARDRAGFKRRIELMEKTISRIFTPLHRDKIFSELYRKQHSWLAHAQRAQSPNECANSRERGGGIKL